MTAPIAILVVDDEAIMREYLSEIFQDQGFKVDKAASGEEAVEKLDKDSFDMLITDLKMPGLNGIEVIKHARKHQGDIKVLLMTAYSLDLSGKEYFSKEKFDCILKPFDLYQVREKVFSALKYDEKSE